jgi:hypothetical protein
MQKGKLKRNFRTGTSMLDGETARPQLKGFPEIFVESVIAMLARLRNSHGAA